MAENLHEFVMRQLLGIAAQNGLSTAARLARITHLLGKYRAELVKPHAISACGLVVQNGPFAGMQFFDRVAEGCYVPKLLGTYEAELHPLLERLPRREYQCVVNIGCAEGFYAVGLARLLPGVTVYAHDQNPSAQVLCRRLAEQNHVGDRVHVGGLFTPEDFARFGGQCVLVLCDIEGAEVELLDPVSAPELRHYDVLVELHDLGGRRVSDEILARFAHSHDIQRIDHTGRDPSRFPFLRNMAQLDQLIALWEWRGGPTPWAFLQARTGATA